MAEEKCEAAGRPLVESIERRIQNAIISRVAKKRW